MLYINIKKELEREIESQRNSIIKRSPILTPFINALEDNTDAYLLICHLLGVNLVASIRIKALMEENISLEEAYYLNLKKDGKDPQ